MDYSALLDLSVDMGCGLLESGAEIYRAEDSLRRLLAGVPAPADRPLRIALVTGAEGGFAPEEAAAAVAAGAKTVGLGPRILRCETAPLAVLASVMTLTGNLE